MDVTLKDYYQILGIPHDSDINTIKRAFRLSAKETHPDSTKQNSYTQFVLIREAYDILTNPSQRAQYDIVWKKYHTQTHTTLQNIIDEFGPPDGRYADEWEYFKLHPEDYLNRFESIIALIHASFKSIIISILIPLLVVLSILAGLTIVLLILFVFAIGITSYSSIIPGIIITGLVIKRFIEIIQNLFSYYTLRAAQWINTKLRGIPMGIGKWVLYGTFACIFILLVAYAALVIFSPVMMVKIAYSRLLSLAIGIITIIVISISLYFVLSVFINALTHYPKIRYTKIKAKKENLLESKLLLH